jgi:hypothetical protein
MIVKKITFYTYINFDPLFPNFLKAQLTEFNPICIIITK